MSLLQRWKKFKDDWHEDNIRASLAVSMNVYKKYLIEIACKSLIFSTEEWENYIKNWFQNCEDGELENIVSDCLNGKIYYRDIYVKKFLEALKNKKESEYISSLQQEEPKKVTKNSYYSTYTEKDIITLCQNWLIWLESEEKNDFQNKMYTVKDDSVAFIPICLECGALQFRTLSHCPCCEIPFNIKQQRRN